MMLVRALTHAFSGSRRILYGFARKVRAAKAQHFHSVAPQVIEAGQASRIKRYQARENKIFQVGKRTLRQQDEEMEREILRLLDQDKSNEEIMKELSRKNQSSQSLPPPSRKPFKPNEGQLEEEFGFTKSVNVPESIGYHQMVMMQHIKKQVEEQNKSRVKKAKKRVQEEDQPIQQAYIPDAYRDSVDNFKNEELKYLSELVENKKSQGERMHRRTPRGHQLPQKKSVVKSEPAQHNIQSGSIVEVQSTQSKVDRMVNRFNETTTSSQTTDFVRRGEQNTRVSELNTNLYLRQKDDVGAFEVRPQTSHNVSKSRVSKLMSSLEKEGLSMDIEQVRQIQKETLMESKHNLEQLQEFRKRMERRQRQKQRKLISQQMDREQLSDKHETKEIYAPLDFNLSKHKLNFGIPNVQKMNQINKNYARSMFNPESRQVDHLDNHTSRNIKEWIWYQLIDGVGNRMSSVFDRITVTDINLNDSNTTVTMKWRLGKNITDSQYVKEDKQEQIVARTQASLDNICFYMAGKMCQDLKLRFGPLVKFKYSQPDFQAALAKEQMRSQMPRVLKAKIMDQVQRGILPPKMKQKDLNKLLNNLESSYQQKLEQINFTAGKKKAQRKTERDNRNQDGSRKKTKKSKVNPADQFWNKL